MLIKHLLEMKKMSDDEKLNAALADLVRDENDPELSEDELIAEVNRVAEKYGITGALKKKLALACEGPIGC